MVVDTKCNFEKPWELFTYTKYGESGILFFDVSAMLYLTQVRCSWSPRFYIGCTLTPNYNSTMNSHDIA